ncbi:hypothetical protein BKA70DRAFT_1326007 [Coprinopsis sp. MPI-PUGE-AT-0042]|nr:hypothetical protein BKA70DRAFT_1326007 [Coprinopsis sp. MPI-PUGE-AT-0042]
MPAFTTSSLIETEDLVVRFEQWQNEVGNEVERQRRYSQALNSILIVGAFIAGVQGQLLSEMLRLDPASLTARTCNLISFLGLVLEIAGTFFGAVNAVKLQLRAQRGTRALDCMEGCKGSLKIVVKYLAKVHAQRRNAEPPADANNGMAEPSPNSPQPSPPSDSSASNALIRFGLTVPPDIPTDNENPISPSSTSGIIPPSVFNVNSGPVNFNIVGGNMMNYHWDSRSISAEVPIEICESIIEGMKQLVVVFGHQTPRILLSAIDSIIDQVYSTRDGEDKGAQPTDEGDSKGRLAVGNRLKYVCLPVPDKQRSPLEKVSLEIVSLVAMGLGVLCLAVSIILFAAARADVLGNKVWATCVSALLTVTLFSVLPFVP